MKSIASYDTHRSTLPAVAMKLCLISLIVAWGSYLLGGCGGGTTTITPPPAFAAQFSVSSSSATPTAGTAFNITVRALDSSGGLVSSYTGTVHFTSSDGQAVLPPDSKLASGVGTFPVTLKTAGGQNLSATDTVTASISGAAPINVNPGAAAQLSVTATSAATTLLPLNVTVNVVDAYMNAATTYAGTVHFTSSDAQATLPADSPLANGTGSFSVTLKTIGSQTITASDTAASLKATSSSINVVSNAATHLSVSGSGTANTRAAFTFTVNALDAANNVAAGYAGTVHFTSSDAQAVLPANSTLTAGSSSNLSATFETAGAQTLSATDTSKGSLNGSSSISVAATPAPTISSSAPPDGAVSTTYGPSSLRKYKCVRASSFPTIWSCSPCGGLTSCFQTLPSCYSSSPCYLLKAVFVGFPFRATGGVPPFVWSATGVPPGLTMSPDGSLSGKPTSPGTFPITVTGTDSGLPSVKVSQNYTITIKNPPPPTVSTTPPPPPGVANVPYSFTFSGSGYGTLTWSETGTLPAGLAFDDTAGTLSGTPTQTGSFPIAVTATDQFKQDSTPANFTIEITLHGFTATGSMATARRFHTATLLGNGKVLIAGGVDEGATAYASAELYDPSTGKFSPTGDMTVPRVGHTATLLNTGKVLITGGTSDVSEAAVSSAELYDPATGTFAATGSMTAARAAHTATLLKDGRVLVAGGDAILFNGVQNTNIKSLASAEIFDPNTGKFEATTGSMTTARESHTATLLNDGRVLVAGGSDGAWGNASPAATALATTELFDPSTGHFSGAGMMTTSRVFLTATLLNTGKVLVAGGVANSGAFLATAELFDPSSASFSITGSMATVRLYHDATLLSDGTVLLSGGWTTNNAILATAEIYDPTAGTFAATGSMQQARIWHTSTLLKNGTVLVTGGSGPLATAELYK